MPRHPRPCCQQAEIAWNSPTPCCSSSTTAVGATATDEAIVKMLRSRSRSSWWPTRWTTRAGSRLGNPVGPRFRRAVPGIGFTAPRDHDLTDSVTLDTLPRVLHHRRPGAFRRSAPDCPDRASDDRQVLAARTARRLQRVIIDDTAGTTVTRWIEFIDSAAAPGVSWTPPVSAAAGAWRGRRLLRLAADAERPRKAEVAVVLLAVDKVLSEQDVRICGSPSNPPSLVLAFNKWTCWTTARTCWSANRQASPTWRRRRASTFHG